MSSEFDYKVVKLSLFVHGKNEKYKLGHYWPFSCGN